MKNKAELKKYVKNIGLGLQCIMLKCIEKYINL